MKKTSDELKILAGRIRKHVLDMTFSSGVNGGHVGGALSSADILATLYGRIMNVSSDRNNDPNRDRFILSKGHTAIAHYAVLAECGFFDIEELATFEKNGSELQTHEVMNIEKGIEISGGSLGYGLSIGVGCALSAKRMGADYRVYVLLGDGECNEGSIWEAVMSAVKFGLNNLIAIVDINEQQLDGYTSDVMPVHSFKDVFEGFGWNTIEVNGNNIDELIEVLERNDNSKPTVVLAHTVKSKGIKSIEGKIGWHHARISEEQYNNLVKELEVGM